MGGRAERGNVVVVQHGSEPRLVVGEHYLLFLIYHEYFRVLMISPFDVFRVDGDRLVHNASGEMAYKAEIVGRRLSEALDIVRSAVSESATHLPSTEDSGHIFIEVESPDRSGPARRIDGNPAGLKVAVTLTMNSKVAFRIPYRNLVENTRFVLTKNLDLPLQVIWDGNLDGLMRVAPGNVFQAWVVISRSDAERMETGSHTLRVTFGDVLKNARTDRAEPWLGVPEIAPAEVEFEIGSR